MKQQFIADTADTLETYVYRNNRKVVPSAAVLTVYKPASAEKLITAQAMTIGADGLLSYSLTDIHNDNAGENYRAVIKATVGNEDQYLTIFYDVVNTQLLQVITDEDVTNELPQLKDSSWRFLGTATGGSVTTIIDPSLKKHPGDYFTGGVAINLTNNESQEITAFVQATGTVTTSTFSAANAAGNKYALQRSFTREIQRAFEKIQEKLRQNGKRAHLVLDPYDLREVHIYFAVAEICKGLTKDGNGSFWWELWKDYEEKAREAFVAVPIKYDASGDGMISEAETNKRMKTIKVRF